VLKTAFGLYKVSAGSSLVTAIIGRAILIRHIFETGNAKILVAGNYHKNNQVVFFDAKQQTVGLIFLHILGVSFFLEFSQEQI